MNLRLLDAFLEREKEKGSGPYYGLWVHGPPCPACDGFTERFLPGYTVRDCVCRSCKLFFTSTVRRYEVCTGCGATRSEIEFNGHREIYRSTGTALFPTWCAEEVACVDFCDPPCFSSAEHEELHGWRLW